MNSAERRIELLRLSKPQNVSVPDMALWLSMADQLDAWVLKGAGQSSDEAQHKPESEASPARTKRPSPPRQQ
jgi:hypothetical protein